MGLFFRLSFATIPVVEDYVAASQWVGSPRLSRFAILGKRTIRKEINHEKTHYCSDDCGNWLRMHHREQK